MLKKKKFSNYLSGVVKIYKDIVSNSDFGAKKNSAKLEDMEFIEKLDFHQLSCRQEDLEYCEQLGFSLAFNIKTHLRRDIKIKYKAVIDNVLYTINFIDYSNKDMFLYLERVRELES